jgi:hypothetical protein
MAESTASTPRFQMVGTRAAVSEGPIPDLIEQQVQALEDAISRVPDFAFDLSKTLVETICKTILEDIGRPADPAWDAPKIMRETTTYLSMLPRNHPNGAKTRDSITKTLNGLHTAVQGLCELRNDYGIASHGRDGFSARLDLRQATLAAQAADTIVSFLYRIHRDALTLTPGARVYYEDHADFNETFDRDHEVIRLGDLELLPSRVLFHADHEAYKAALNDHIAERDGDDDKPVAAQDEALKETS